MLLLDSLELELERDKRERDARERELREQELRTMEMREKLKAELEMKPPGKNVRKYQMCGQVIEPRHRKLVHTFPELCYHQISVLSAPTFIEDSSKTQKLRN